MPVPETLSRAQARRIALAAQGFTDPRTGLHGRRVDRRHVHRVLDRVDLVQIDSVNVCVRSQEMPLFSRLGPHPRDLWHRMGEAHEVFEFWAHEASLLPVDHWPLMQWAMASGRMWGGSRNVAETRPDYVEAVFEEVQDRGPLTAGQLSDPGPKQKGMWERSDGKKALEYLFGIGRITGRRDPSTFARVYDTVERSIPADVLARPALSEPDARRELIDRAARANGLATERCLTDYHRLNGPKTRPHIAELVEEGRLIPVTVEGWPRTTYLHVDATLPRWVRARALLTPFDSLVWERRRLEELFDFHYRIEIYVRPEDRVHGYYVMPFLLGDRMVARVDLKSDRPVSTLRVQSAHREPGTIEADVAEALAAELALMAGWLGLEQVAVEPRGDLAPALRAAVAATPVDG
ncbi:winged helix-turn-helix domain-containing protein [Iamia sp. SCSIO 61187]|uniref:winged helix-turn-helix domain-containing protein n=1 Tax=Iamia sp. SCSIO 61187 TaxID=2722752 RepID=UPI001C631F1C|nr:crosslink repair DNA glycosylase YcaQ family protein [Iamia sp. SCSIO 61187]QYG92555.1 winged helix-turn-helix domain-containing protein [Iamia sp. SCSIO 61187]